MKFFYPLLLSFLINYTVFSQTFTTNTTPVGMEHNLLFNAASNYTVTQTGTAQLNLPSLFDGKFVPSYTSVAPTTANPTVVLIENLPATHVQTGAWVGWSTRYWEAKNFKIEGYNTYLNANEWVSIADYSTTAYSNSTGSRKFSVKVPSSRAYTKLRFTFYSAAGTDGRLGVSELFFIHPEATAPYANLGLGAWSKNGTEISTSSTVKAQKLLLNDPNTVTDWNNLWQSGFYSGNNTLNAPETSGWFWGLNMNHVSNSETYKYNGQLAIRNTSTEPSMYFRSTNADGTGTWAKIIDDHGDQTINGKLILSGTGDGTSLLTFDTDRAWSFQNKNTGSISSLQLTSHVSGKFFDIGANTSGNKVASFFANDNVDNQTVFLVADGGKVGIGTTTPKNKLSVNGTIWATKVKVTLEDAADWVFEDSYKLRPLSEVAAFIKEHKHLPEIPSADEFRANDMEVSQMTNKLLQKIEELTLYTINQEKELKLQTEKLQTQEQKLKKMDDLEVRLQKIEALLLEK